MERGAENFMMGRERRKKGEKGETFEGLKVVGGKERCAVS